MFRGSQTGFDMNGSTQVKMRETQFSQAPAGPERQPASMRKTIDNPRGGSVARVGSISHATP